MDNWSGDDCSEFDPCEPSPCKNDGVCTDVNNLFECACVNGFEGRTCEDSPCSSQPCGEGLCTEISTGYECDCSQTDFFGPDCAYKTCPDLNCGLNGQAVILFDAICTCSCDEGYQGNTCDTPTPTDIDDPCNMADDYNGDGQTCDTSAGTCVCDAASGFIEDEFVPSPTYGECVGPVPECTTDNDCLYDQTCNQGYCNCKPSAGDLCLKDGEWVCVYDPFENDPWYCLHICISILLP